MRLSLHPEAERDLQRIEAEDIRILVVKHDGRRPGFGERRA
ncbi:MAG: hypothetical protein AB7O31_13545 [Burkholderiales bacterium]